MYEAILSLLKPHVANKVRCESLAARLDAMFQDRCDLVRNGALDEGYEYGYSDGCSDGAIEFDDDEPF